MKFCVTNCKNFFGKVYIQKTAWDELKNFDHALVLREDDPLLPAILDVYEKQGIKNVIKEAV